MPFEKQSVRAFRAYTELDPGIAKSELRRRWVIYKNGNGHGMSIRLDAMPLNHPDAILQGLTERMLGIGRDSYCGSFDE
jgi:hypothetical protein